MNCKPGDLAIVVSGKVNIGRILHCVRLATQAEINATRLLIPQYEGTSMWITDRALTVARNVGRETRDVFLCPDVILRPIRDPGEDAQDESLTWFPKIEGLPA